MNALLLVFAFAVESDLTPSKQKGELVQNLNLGEPLLERWLAGSLQLPDEAFVPVGDLADFLFRPLQESKGSLSVFLQPDVDPHRQPQGVRWQVHAADRGGIDLLRTDYDAHGVQLSLRENVNFVVLRASRLERSLSQANTRDYVSGLIQAVVKTAGSNHHWVFELPQDLDARWEGRLISSENAVPLKDLGSRYDRADVLIWQGTVHFIFYKKADQREDFLPDDSWFTSQARAQIRARLPK